MESKPGYRTTEFYAVLLASVTTWLGHISQSGQLPLDLSAKIQGALALGYAIARGLAKLGTAFHDPNA